MGLPVILHSSYKSGGWPSLSARLALLPHGLLARVNLQLEKVRAVT
jgi:hypothetical protein